MKNSLGLFYKKKKKEKENWGYAHFKLARQQFLQGIWKEKKMFFFLKFGLNIVKIY